MTSEKIMTSEKTADVERRPHVYRAMSNVQKTLAEQGIQKLEKNQFSKYMFRGIDAVMNAVAPLLPANDLLIIPSVIGLEQSDRLTAKGETQIHTVIKMQYTFVSVIDGSSHVMVAAGEAMDKGDKSLNQADTAAFKNMMFKTFCIPVEGQGDADERDPEPSVKAQPQTQEPLVTPEDVKVLRDLIEETNTDEAQYCKFLKVDKLESLPLTMVAAANAALMDKKNKQERRAAASVSPAKAILGRLGRDWEDLGEPANE